jgi:hypothetical protein
MCYNVSQKDSFVAHELSPSSPAQLPGKAGNRRQREEDACHEGAGGLGGTAGAGAGAGAAERGGC